jgi:hypothetical protein
MPATGYGGGAQILSSAVQMMQNKKAYDEAPQREEAQNKLLEERDKKNRDAELERALAVQGAMDDRQDTREKAVLTRQEQMATLQEQKFDGVSRDAARKSALAVAAQLSKTTDPKAIDDIIQSYRDRYNDRIDKAVNGPNYNYLQRESNYFEDELANVLGHKASQDGVKAGNPADDIAKALGAGALQKRPDLSNSEAINKRQMAEGKMTPERVAKMQRLMDQIKTSGDTAATKNSLVNGLTTGANWAKMPVDAAMMGAGFVEGLVGGDDATQGLDKSINGSQSGSYFDNLSKESLEKMKKGSKGGVAVRDFVGDFF